MTAETWPMRSMRAGTIPAMHRTIRHRRATWNHGPIGQPARPARTRGTAMLLKLEPRPSASATMRYVSPLAAVALTLFASLFLFAALGKDPFTAFRVFFLNPLRDMHALTE